MSERKLDQTHLQRIDAKDIETSRITQEINWGKKKTHNIIFHTFFQLSATLYLANKPRCLESIWIPSLKSQNVCMPKPQASPAAVPWGWSWYVSCSASWVSPQRGWRAASLGLARWTEQHASWTASCCCPRPQQRTPPRRRGSGSFSCVGGRSPSTPGGDAGGTDCKWGTIVKETLS